MHAGQIKYALRVVRKGYKDASLVLALINFVLLLFFAVFAFLLLVFEPPSDWHSTTFTLATTEYHYSRGGGVLYLYTTDGRSFALNENEEEIRHQLVDGQSYGAVYSDDFFHDIIKALNDRDNEYLDLERSHAKFQRDKVLWCKLASVSVLLLISINGIFAAECINSERKRLQAYQKGRRKRK